MEETIGEHGKLIEDIRQDAAAEAAKLIADAERSVGERREAYERQLAEIGAEAKKAATEQTAALEKSLQASFSVELRRISLHARERLFKEILDRIERTFLEKTSDKNYPGILLGWIVEAAIGLGAEKTHVNASAGECALINAALLKKAAEKVMSLTHQKVVIEQAAEPPLLPQGIVLSSADGKTAFNNQVRTRMERNQSHIRKLIYDRLMSGEGGKA